MKLRMVLLLILFTFEMAEGSGVWSLEQKAAVRFGATAKFKVSIVDDERNVVTNAMVSVGFGQQGNKQLGEVVSVMTDENGLAEVEGRTTGDNLWIKVEKEGYYSSKTNFNYIAVDSRHEVRFNRWQPYGEKHTIVLRDKKRPIDERIVVKPNGGYSHIIPSEDSWVGFDLMKNDWVHPFGKGSIADLNVRIQSDGMALAQNKQMEMNVEIMGESNGGYFKGLKSYSVFRYSYCADEDNAYSERILDFHRIKHKGGTRSEKDPLAGKEMIARIRTQKNADGKIENCYYVRIIGMGMARTFSKETVFSVDYRLNKSPNDANLETF